MMTRAQRQKWIKETSAILDAMERNPPSAAALAPFRTKNWINKGWILGRTWGPGQDSPARKKESQS